MYIYSVIKNKLKINIMNKLKKEVLDVKIGDKLMCNIEIDYFTKGSKYGVIDVDYIPGTNSFELTVLDDDCDEHTLTESFVGKNFTLIK